MPIKLLIEGQVVEVDERFAEVSELIKENWQPGQEEQIPLSNTQVTRAAFDVLRSYVEFNNFQPKLIEKIDKSPDVCFLNQHDKELIMAFSIFDDDRLLGLLNAAIYLNVKSFRKLCLARIAIAFYLDRQKPNESFAEMKKDHKLENLTLTLGDVERHKKLYPQVVTSFI